MRKPDRKEAKEASKDGASLVTNSGRGHLKGDAVLGNFLLDYKHNERSFTLSQAAWQKHSDDAWNDIKGDPLIKVVFGNGKAVAIIDWDMFEYFREVEWMYQDLCE